MSEGVNVDLLITRPRNTPGSVSDYVDLHDFCDENGIETIDTVNVNSKECISQLSSGRFDVLLTLGWSQLFSPEFLSQFDIVVGSHPTKLPQGKGRAPVPWTILQNLKSSAVSFFIMDEGVDSGAVILQKEFDIPERPTALSVYSLVADNLSEGFIEIVQCIRSGKKLQTMQLDKTLSTHNAKRTAEDGHLSFDWSAADIDRLVRAVSYPYPGAYSYYKSTKVSFFSSSLVDEDDYDGVNGQILEKSENAIRVKCGQQSVWLSEFKDEIGTHLDVSFFKLHDKLGYCVEDEIYRLNKAIEKLKEE